MTSKKNFFFFFKVIDNVIIDGYEVKEDNLKFTTAMFYLLTGSSKELSTKTKIISLHC